MHGSLGISSVEVADESLIIDELMGKDNGFRLELMFNGV
jgi:hypothetical protein